MLSRWLQQQPTSSLKCCELRFENTFFFTFLSQWWVCFSKLISMINVGRDDCSSWLMVPQLVLMSLSLPSLKGFTPVKLNGSWDILLQTVFGKILWLDYFHNKKSDNVFNLTLIHLFISNKTEPIPNHQKKGRKGCSFTPPGSTELFPFIRYIHCRRN